MSRQQLSPQTQSQLETVKSFQAILREEKKKDKPSMSWRHKNRHTSRSAQKELTPEEITMKDFWLGYIGYQAGEVAKFGHNDIKKPKSYDPLRAIDGLKILKRYTTPCTLETLPKGNEGTLLRYQDYLLKTLIKGGASVYYFATGDRDPEDLGWVDLPYEMALILIGNEWPQCIFHASHEFYFGAKGMIPTEEDETTFTVVRHGHQWLTRERIIYILLNEWERGLPKALEAREFICSDYADYLQAIRDDITDATRAKH